DTDVGNAALVGRASGDHAAVAGLGERARYGWPAHGRVHSARRPGAWVLGVQEAGEKERVARTVGPVQGDDLQVRQRDARVQRLDRRVVPVSDLAGVDLR